jgi:H+/Cl- antiporter ClcA
MNLDDRIAYFGGFTMTTMMTISMNDVIMTATLGLIGGFFGILGKQVFYSLRDLLNKKWKK